MKHLGTFAQPIVAAVRSDYKILAYKYPTNR